VSGILEGVVSTLFDHPSLKNVKKPVLVAVVVAGRYIYLTQTGSESQGFSQVCLLYGRFLYIAVMVAARYTVSNKIWF
jgi:hypothetical protein